jgi:AraC-like DNA-binding protein
MPRETHRPAEASIGGWQAAVSQAYFSLETEARREGRFNGQLDAWPLGPISATRIACDPVLYRRTPAHLRDDRDDAILISIPTSSRVHFSQNARDVICEPGGFVIERSDAPYEYWHAEPDVQWVVKVPRDGVQARVGSAERYLSLSVDARSGLAAFFVASLDCAIRHADAFDDRVRATTGAYLLDLLCLAIKNDQRALGSFDGTVRRAHLERAEAFIDANLKDPGLSPARVAEGCGISLRYLQRLFAETGLSITEHIREQRLARCHEDLIASRHDQISTVAYRWGFTDHAQFCRRYRTRFGRTPSDTRRAGLSHD